MLENDNEEELGVVGRLFNKIGTNARIEHYRDIEYYNLTHEDYDLEKEAHAKDMLTLVDRFRMGVHYAYTEFMDELRNPLEPL